jgi:hypothetical protein
VSQARQVGASRPELHLASSSIGSQASARCAPTGTCSTGTRPPRPASPPSATAPHSRARRSSRSASLFRTASSWRSKATPATTRAWSTRCTGAPTSASALGPS